MNRYAKEDGYFKTCALIMMQKSSISDEYVAAVEHQLVADVSKENGHIDTAIPKTSKR